MNLDMKIHPAVAGLVIALSALAIGLKFWADGEALRYSGPAQLLTDPSGNLYIQIQNQLLEHDAEGAFVKRHDLGELGVDTVIGTLAFFSNGDLLLRRGEDQRSFWNKLAAYRRRENQSDLVPESPGAGLARCDLQTRYCRDFATPPLDFKSTIGVYVDWDSDTVFVSDTSRHTLRKYSGSGEIVAEPRRDFRFPNQLFMHEGRLLVADTNRHRIRIVDPAADTFGRTITPVSVVPEAAHRDGLRWPSHFARIGDEWWVNNMNRAMRNGGVFVFDADWRYLRRIPLPAKADPIAILPFASGALISDWDNDRVYRVANTGTVLEDFVSPGLDAVLSESRAQRDFYRALSWMGLALLGVVFIGLITKAMMSPPAPPASRSDHQDNPIEPDTDTPVWFEPDPTAVGKLRLSIYLAVVASALLVIMGIVITIAYGNAEFAASVLPLIGSLIVICLLIFKGARTGMGTAIGFDGTDVILRDHTGAESRCPVRSVVHDKTLVATPTMVVALGKDQMPIYAPDVVSDQILPRLATARAISPLRMQGILIRSWHPMGITVLLALIGLAICGAVYLLR